MIQTIYKQTLLSIVQNFPKDFSFQSEIENKYLYKSLNFIQKHPKQRFEEVEIFYDKAAKAAKEWKIKNQNPIFIPHKIPNLLKIFEILKTKDKTKDTKIIQLITYQEIPHKIYLEKILKSLHFNISLIEKIRNLEENTF